MKVRIFRMTRRSWEFGKFYDAECPIVVGRPCQGTGRNSGCLKRILLGVLGHVGLMGI